jgi:hypothetical protein
MQNILPKNLNIKGLLMGLVAIFIFIKVRAANKEQEELDFIEAAFDLNTKEGQAAQAAVRLNMALNPSGFSILRGMDGTNVSKVKDMLSSMRSGKIDIRLVAEFYNERYDSDLLADLEKELSTSEWEEVFGRSESVIELR